MNRRNIASIKKNMGIHSGETFETRTGSEFTMTYDGGNTFDVGVVNGRTHCCTIKNLERVVDAVNDGKTTLTSPIASITSQANCTASASYIVGLLTDGRI